MKSVLNRLDPDSYGPASDQLEDEGDIEGATRLRKMGEWLRQAIGAYEKHAGGVYGVDVSLSPRVRLEVRKAFGGWSEKSGSGNTIVKLALAMIGNGDENFFSEWKSFTLMKEQIEKKGMAYVKRRLLDVVRWAMDKEPK